MLTIQVPMGQEMFNDETDEFFYSKDEVFVLELEHSLLSISKWEEEFEKPFLVEGEKTPEEILAYIKAMTLTPDVPPEVFLRLTEENGKAISSYIDAKRSATWFREIRNEQQAPSEIITNELVYYWMFSFQIPIECETWFLNRLFTLIKIFSVKNSDGKQKQKPMTAAERRALNEERRRKYENPG